MIMYRIAADSLTDKGRYVFSIEHYDLRNRLLGQPRARRYTPDGMYYCHMEKEDILRETAPFFRDVRVRPITAIVPLSGRLGHCFQLLVSRIAEKLPLVKNLGELLLVSAQAPIRQPKEGQHTSGNRLYKAIDHWYSKRIHRNTKISL